MSPSFSVIVPVLCEEERINSLVDHVRALGYGLSVEILVADGHPERTTLAALDRPGVIPIPSSPGRARQMNQAALAASGDVLVFLHADCALPPRAFEAMEAVLADGGYTAGAFDLAIRSDKPSLKLIARAASIRSRLTGTPYGDQTIFITRAAFASLGGFAVLPILEDVDLVRRLRRAGMRLGFAKGRVTTSDRRWELEGIWRRTFANWTIIALYLLGVSPYRLASLYETRPVRKESP